MPLRRTPLGPRNADAGTSSTAARHQPRVPPARAAPAAKRPAVGDARRRVPRVIATPPSSDDEESDGAYVPTDVEDDLEIEEEMRSEMGEFSDVEEEDGETDHIAGQARLPCWPACVSTHFPCLPPPLGAGTCKHDA